MQAYWFLHWAYLNWFPPPPPSKIIHITYLLYSQIWLNYFLDDPHSGYVTKSLKETPAQTHLGVSPLQTKHMHNMIHKCINMDRAKGRQGEKRKRKKRRSNVVYCLQ